ncbi:MAG: hypothetical protein IKF96_01985 [Eggerthellaceae bacterium]|nr:hypothetical protein [Eggerthellaceae bacterium]
MGMDANISRRRALGATAGLVCAATGLVCTVGAFAEATFAHPRTISQALRRLYLEALSNGASGVNDPDAGLFATLTGASYAPRLESLDGRVIGFVSTGQMETDRTFPVIREYLERVHGCTVFDESHFTQGTGVIAREDNGIAEAMRTLGVEGAILGNAGCYHCATAVGRAAAQLELAGLPTAIVGQRYYENRLSAAFADFGLPAQPTVGQYVPMEVFEPDSDLASLAAALPGVLGALTSWNWAFRTPRA